MIPLITVLEHLRKQKGMIRNCMAKHFGETLSNFNYKHPDMALVGFIQSENLPDFLIVPWCEYLELGITDYEPLFQYNARQRLYEMLQVVTDYKLPNNVIRSITDILHFYSDISFVAIQKAILPTILERIHEQPFVISNALMDLEGEIPNGPA